MKQQIAAAALAASLRLIRRGGAGEPDDAPCRDRARRGGHAVVLFDSRMPLKPVAPGIIATNFWLTDSYPPNLLKDDPSGRPIGTAPPTTAPNSAWSSFCRSTPPPRRRCRPRCCKRASQIRRSAALRSSIRWHRTRSLDYAIILSGEIDMMLDDESVHLKPGDVIVQQATNHGWVNRGKEPCRILFVLMDSKEP